MIFLCLIFLLPFAIVLCFSSQKVITSINLITTGRDININGSVFYQAAKLVRWVEVNVANPGSGANVFISMPLIL